MRFNTRNKRARYKRDIIKYLHAYKYSVSKDEVNNWIEGGINSLADASKEAIRNALTEIIYKQKVRS